MGSIDRGRGSAGFKGPQAIALPPFRSLQTELAQRQRAAAQAVPEAAQVAAELRQAALAIGVADLARQGDEEIDRRVHEQPRQGLARGRAPASSSACRSSRRRRSGVAVAPAAEAHPAFAIVQDGEQLERDL